MLHYNDSCGSQKQKQHMKEYLTSSKNDKNDKNHDNDKSKLATFIESNITNKLKKLFT